MSQSNSRSSQTSSVISSGEWLAVSTEGFAEQQRGRPLNHLLKELVQNSLDGVGESGEIKLNLSMDEENPALLRVECVDNGEGSADLSKLNIVFVTGKKDSVVKRGRMGRGFKELLSVASEARVKSGSEELIFNTNGAGVRQVTLNRQVAPRTKGFAVSMTVEHDDVKAESDIKGLTDYFDTFIIPEGIKFRVNGKISKTRQLVHKISARMVTERFSNSRWDKPSLSTEIHLYKCRGEETGLIYEMGIPVCSINWSMPYHADVRQRVPMNPNRDAVMTLYDARLRKACLPTVVEELTEDEVKASWVGDAAVESTPEVQETVIKKAFGENAVRFVPTFGDKFDHNASAREHTGANVVDTKHMTGSFSKLAKEHLKTSKTVVDEYHSRLNETVAETGVGSETLEDAPFESGKYIARFGKDRVRRMMVFAKHFCEDLIARKSGNKKVSVEVAAAVLPHAEASWAQNQKLSLSLCLEYWWNEPVGSRHFAVLVHECAHHEAAHHGTSFAARVEEYAGHAVALMIESESLRRMAAEVHTGKQTVTDANGGNGGDSREESGTSPKAEVIPTAPKPAPKPAKKSVLRHTGQISLFG